MREVGVAVIGASGTTGGELLRLLDGHPSARVAFLGAHGSAGRSLAEVHPHLVGIAAAGLPLRTLDPGDVSPVAAAAEVAFLALPHGASAELAPVLLAEGLRVIDLAGDFRLAPEEYPEWYGFEHPAPAWSSKAVYGLPELFGDRVTGAELIANPGCYPTPVILGISPLLSAGLLDPGPVRVDGKTGLSGAGKTANSSTVYTATQDSVRPYRLPHHQHTPEMERGIELATGSRVGVLFAPHLVPTVRGVVTTCYGPLANGATTASLTEALDAAYEGSAFVRVLPPGGMVDSKRVRGSNLVELQAVADPRTGTAVVVGAVDNLVKGAAGQAIQNMNLALGFDEGAGLPTVGVYP